MTNNLDLTNIRYYQLKSLSIDSKVLQPFCYKLRANATLRKMSTRYFFFFFKKKASPYSTSKNSFIKRKQLPILLLPQKNPLKKSLPNLPRKRKRFLFSSLPLCLQGRHNVGSSSRSSNTTTGVHRYKKYQRKKDLIFTHQPPESFFKRLFIGTDLGKALTRMTEDKALLKGLQEEDVERGR